MSDGSMTMKGFIGTVHDITGRMLTSNEPINSIKQGLDARMLSAGDPMLEAMRIKNAISEGEGANKIYKGFESDPGWVKRGESLFRNRRGEIEGARVAAGIAGSYMGLNLVANGNLGIPFISD